MYPSMQPEPEGQTTERGHEFQSSRAAAQSEKRVEPGTPEQYADIKLPEGTAIDERTASEFKGLVRKMGMTQERAQKALDYGNQIIKQRMEAIYKPWHDNQAKWEAEVKADPEIGGAKFEQNMETARLVFQPSDSNPFIKNAGEATALKRALIHTGAGNHPAVIKLFRNAGRFIAGRRSGGDKLLNQLYPSM
jgi:hypothetical protein